MGLLKMLGKLAVAAVVGVAALTIVGKIQQASPGKPAKAPDEASEAGFVLLKPEDANNGSVVIMAAPNCPREEARRAHALGEELARIGIPHRIESDISFEPKDEKDAERIQKFMNNAAQPLVFIRGRGKGAPTLEAVVAEYRSTPRK